MYNLVFWDFLPTLIAHKYYCATECKFEVYKTAEQWRQENPDAVVGPIKMPEGIVLDGQGYGTLYQEDGTKLIYFFGNKKTEPSLWLEESNGSGGYWMNNRFYKAIEKKSLGFISTIISSEKIIDSVTDDVMAEYVVVGSGYPHQDWQSIKIWLDIATCNPPNSRDYADVNKSFRGIKNGQ